MSGQDASELPVSPESSFDWTATGPSRLENRSKRHAIQDPAHRIGPERWKLAARGDRISHDPITNKTRSYHRSRFHTRTPTTHRAGDPQGGEQG